MDFKSAKYMTGLKSTSTTFTYTTADSGKTYIEYKTGRNAITDVVEKLTKLAQDLNVTSEDVKTMLSSYVLDDTVDLSGFVNAVNGSMNSMAAEMSQLIQAALTEAQSMMDKSEALDQATAQNLGDAAAQIDPNATGSNGAAGGAGTPAATTDPTAATDPALAGMTADDAATAAALGLTPEQLDVVKATIRHEAGNNPAEIANVASCIKNRMNSGAWGGTDAYSVVTAKGQFASYLGGHYKQYTGGNYYQGDAGTAAAVDQTINSILLGTTPPTHNYQSFRGKGSPEGTQLVEGGNKYR